MPSVIWECKAQAARMRADGYSSAGVAAELGRGYGLTPRAAFRVANGMTLEDVATAWNTRWTSTTASPASAYR